MSVEPRRKRAIAFVDGQNLFHAVRNAFGYTYPNFDVQALASAVCQKNGWELAQTRFYTGVPEAEDDAYWSSFWESKLLAMSRSGMHVFSRKLRYRNKIVMGESGQAKSVLIGEEKGIDVRLALDVVGLAYRQAYDVAIIFSQDQDLSEAVQEVRLLGAEQQRWIKLASAFPMSPTARNRRGIDKTDWIRIDRATYDNCLDRRDYRMNRGAA